MEENQKYDTTTGSSESGNGRSGSPSRFDDVKNTVADKLHDAAGALRSKVSAPEAEKSGFARYGYQASNWLDQSAEYVRGFDYQRANAKVRDYVRQNPGRSLLMAGAVGLIVGAMVRRR
jgi:ElaB/YqjD/DUF883 family membrane-anchored ribosome-binding protein